MRDFLLNSLENQGVDIDIIDGQAAYLSESSQTTDQRAGIAAYVLRGSVPGMPDFGIGWADQYTQDNTVTQLNNDINVMVQELAVSVDQDADNPVSSSYTPILCSKDGDVGVVIIKG